MIRYRLAKSVIGQRIAVAPVGEHELAFVVRAPEVVRLVGPGQRRALPRATGGAAAASPGRGDPSTAWTVLIGGTVQLRIAPPQALADLRGAPRGILPLQPDDRLLDRHRQLVGVPVGRRLRSVSPCTPQSL